MWFKTKYQGKIIDVEIFRKRITIDYKDIKDVFDYGKKPYSCYDLKIILLDLNKCCELDEVIKIENYILNNCRYLKEHEIMEGIKQDVNGQTSLF